MNESIKVPWLTIKDDALYYTGTGAFVFFVPESFFEHDHAFQEGDYVHTMGILNWVVMKKADDKPADYALKAKPFTFPSAITTKPGRIEKVKKLKIKESQEAQDFRVFIYENNKEDQVIASLHSVQDIVNVEKIMSIFEITGKIPPGISYLDLYKYFVDSMTINGGKYPLSMQEFGLLYAEICRSPHDYSKPFRLTKDLDKDPYSYRCVSIKDVSNLVSPFTAITTENWDKSVISAATIDEKDIKDTPMERIMMD